MTIVTALNDGQSTWLGYNDGEIVFDTPVASEKQGWLTVEDWAIGIAGEAVQHDVLAFNLKKLSGAGENPLLLIEKIRNVLVEYNHTLDGDDDAAPSFEISGILAHKNGNIWDVSSCLAITKIPGNTLWARGSGKQYALGASRILGDLSLTPKEQVFRSTEVAIAFDLYCPGNAKVFELQLQKS